MLAILAGLLAMAMPRYLGARKKAIIQEADEILLDMKTVAWAYYVERETWSGVTSSNLDTALGFAPPPDDATCWEFGLAVPGTDSEIQLQAKGDNLRTSPKPVRPVQKDALCGLVADDTVTLIIRADGSATRIAP